MAGDQRNSSSGMWAAGHGGSVGSARAYIPAICHSQEQPTTHEVARPRLAPERNHIRLRRGAHYVVTVTLWCCTGRGRDTNIVELTPWEGFQLVVPPLDRETLRAVMNSSDYGEYIPPHVEQQRRTRHHSLGRPP